MWTLSYFFEKVIKYDCENIIVLLFCVVQQWGKTLLVLHRPALYHTLITVDSCVVQPFSKYLPRTNDMSFWLPETGFSSNDFYDLVRSIGGDTVLKVILNDVYTTQTSPPRTSHCYTITYQLPDGPITQADVAVIHSRIETAASELLGVEIRWMLTDPLERSFLYLLYGAWRMMPNGVCCLISWSVSYGVPRIVSEMRVEYHSAHCSAWNQHVDLGSNSRCDVISGRATCWFINEIVCKMTSI